MEHQTLAVMPLKCRDDAGITWLYVVIGIKKTIVMFDRSTCGCAPQLSTNTNMFSCRAFILLFRRPIHYVHMMIVIHAFLFARYSTGRSALSTPRKHLGFSDLAITSGFTCSPATEHANNTAKRSFDVLMPSRGLPLMTIDLCGSAQ